jgi:diacylglycerol kinase
VKNRSLFERLGFAVAGWKAAWARERSFRTQAWFAALAFLMLLVTLAAPIWWAVFAIVCALILALELINSALEALIDLHHPAIHPEIKVIYDMLAGAVLIVSCAALLVGAALVFTYCRAVLESFQT